VKTVTIADMTEILEELAPTRLAETWDNPGLQIGQKEWPVRKVWVALDPLPEVVSAACDRRIDLLVTHHPLIFKPLKSIDYSSPIGRIILLSAQNSLAVYAAHTNLDSVAGGINDRLVSAVGLTEVSVLGEESVPGSGEGLGRVGRLSNRICLSDLVTKIKQRMNLEWVRWSGGPDMPVTHAAVCSGSGGGMMDFFFASGAQVFITGDLKYHEARDAQARGMGLIDIGHFGSEHLITRVLADRLREKIAEKGLPVTVEACDLERDPFNFS